MLELKGVMAWAKPKGRWFHPDPHPLWCVRQQNILAECLQDFLAEYLRDILAECLCDILAEYLAVILGHNIADILVYMTWQATLWSTDF